MNLRGFPVVYTGSKSDNKLIYEKAEKKKTFIFHFIPIILHKPQCLLKFSKTSSLGRDIFRELNDTNTPSFLCLWVSEVVTGLEKKRKYPGNRQQHSPISRTVIYNKFTKTAYTQKIMAPKT